MKDMIDECERLRGLTAEPDTERSWPVYPRLFWVLYGVLIVAALIVVFFVMR